jgi:nicotinic acid phosphoribosyltransferase
LQNIYQSLYAIVFFGTPHRGSSYAEVGITAQQIAKAIGFDANDSLLRNLRPDGEHLEMLREEFASMLDERAFKVYSFQEGQGLKGTRTLARKVRHPGF